MKIEKINIDGKKTPIEVMDKIFAAKINKQLVSNVLYVTNANYKKSSFNLGWRVQPITSIKGRRNYKWGRKISIHPNNLANPFTRRVPSLIDFLQTKEPRYLFYTLEDWEIDKTKELTVESDLIIKAALYWRLMIFTNNLNEKEKKIAKHFLKTISNISHNKLKKQNYWLYKDGLMQN